MPVNGLDMLVTRLNSSFPLRVIIGLAKIIGFLLPIRNRSALFFFFPFCHVGGAERVHADIAQCFAREMPWIIFTKRSDNEKFRPFFKGGRTLNLWHFCKYGYPLSIGILAGFINRHRDAVVLGSNSLVYYLLLPYLREDIRKIDLLHAFGAGIEEYSLATAPILDGRVVINGKTDADLRQLYRDQGMPTELDDRITLIGNRVTVPGSYPLKGERTRLSLLYVGRGSEEKRVHLVGQLATQCRRKGLPVDVLLAGDVAGAVAPEDHASCSFVGEIADDFTMARLYDNADLLLLTSIREGFPLVIMEAMAHGVIPLTTAVGGIAEHVIDGINGWLVSDAIEEDQIVTRMCVIVERMCAERQLLATMSRAAYEHACAHFGGEQFCTAWRQVLGVIR
jgi:glycosyltransferase involved in cell wall biosynthesis